MFEGRSECRRNQFLAGWNISIDLEEKTELVVHRYYLMLKVA